MQATFCLFFFVFSLFLWSSTLFWPKWSHQTPSPSDSELFRHSTRAFIVTVCSEHLLWVQVSFHLPDSCLFSSFLHSIWLCDFWLTFRLLSVRGHQCNRHHIQSSSVKNAFFSYKTKFLQKLFKFLLFFEQVCWSEFVVRLNLLS